MTAILNRFCRFLERAERSPHTIRNYRNDLESLAAWFASRNEEPFSPSTLTPADLRAYKRWLIAQDRKPRTINRKLATIKSFLHWAVDVRLLRSGHGLRVTSPVREAAGGPRWLDHREQHRLRRVVERIGTPRDIAAVTLLLHTGVRVSELCALAWKDVSVSERHGLLTVRHGKGGKRRDIPLNRDARWAIHTLGYSEHAGTSERMFRGQRGPLTPRGVQLLLARYARTTGLQRVTPHALRHSFCKNLVNAGVGLEKVARLAGHDSLETTRRYCEPSLQDLEQVVELVSERE
jgi:site-specific recombinase XerD